MDARSLLYEMANVFEVGNPDAQEVLDYQNQVPYPMSLGEATDQVVKGKVMQVLRELFIAFRGESEETDNARWANIQINE